MTQIAAVPNEAPTAKLPALATGGTVRPIVPQDFESAFRIANAVVKSGMAPRGLDTPEKALIAVLHGLEVGFTPMAALQSIAVINSRATIWGDGALGLVQASGKMESHKEWLEGQGEHRKAICTVKRKGDPEPKTGEFSVADAKKAKLWGKQGPWTDYPDRMLKMRARAFALRDGFSDVLKGLGIAEEVQDVPVQAPPPPPAPAMAPPPPARVIEHQPEPEIEVQPFDPDAFLANLFVEMDAAQSAELVMEVWDANDVESRLTDHEDKLQDAFDMRKQCLDKFEDGIPEFPGDR